MLLAACGDLETPPPHVGGYKVDGSNGDGAQWSARPAALVHGKCWVGMCGAALLGVVATYSFANGMLFWPIGLWVLWVVTTPGERRAGRAGLWVLAGVLVTVSYYWHYEKPAEHPPLTLVFTMPLAYSAYVLKYLGTMCAQWSDGRFALVFGLAGVLGLALVARILLRFKRVGMKALAPYLGMGAYSFGSALATGLGRVGFGSDQALSSRYCTTTVPLWGSLVVLFYLFARADWGLQVEDIGRRRRAKHGRHQRVFAWSMLAIMLTALILSSLAALDNAADNSRKRGAGRDALVEWATNSGAEPDYKLLVFLYPKPEVVVERARVLAQHRLGIFKSLPAGDRQEEGTTNPR